MSSNITLRNKLYKCIIINFVLNLQLYNKRNFLLTITIIFLNYSLLINITENKHDLLQNINVFCGKSLYAFTKHYFYLLIIKTV